MNHLFAFMADTMSDGYVRNSFPTYNFDVIFFFFFFLISSDRFLHISSVLFPGIIKGKGEERKWDVSSLLPAATFPQIPNRITLRMSSSPRLWRTHNLGACCVVSFDHGYGGIHRFQAVRRASWHRGLWNHRGA